MIELLFLYCLSTVPGDDPELITTAESREVLFNLDGYQDKPCWIESGTSINANKGAKNEEITTN